MFVGKGLTSLKKLQNLRIDCNRLLKIDTPELSSCVQLKVLDISYNMLDNLAVSPTTCGNYCFVEELIQIERLINNINNNNDNNDFI